MAHILIVDDEENIRKIITKYALFEGHTVDEAEDGMEAVIKCRENQYQIVIMDVMMKELDGFSASREIRKTSNVPIIMLSARGEEYDRLHGFDIGIDDYVVKPFSPKELMMRINAILRRHGTTPTQQKDMFTKDGLTIDFTARQVIVDGVSESLSPKEYDLLAYLIRNKGIAVTREQIINNVWGYDFDGDERTLDTHIKLLRRRLKQYAYNIVTLRGVGYRFEA